ncbi:hypothetical protein AB2Q22_12245 [Listeria monocytogenes]|uniref:hypothetical protein n=2 Tax=Listeria monocytogenes TaxID=1639 RepID=UPI00112F2F24|nr:hypothetical protein [Listeria monocytogenes]EAG7774149.1 hypothetical protein [Listeria monocytogenes]EAG7939361.1 hypothetical protein [Listeria monocytogenes]EAG7999484.1 hypothetical protein [Listeria monocytogenes]EAW0592987.1 hypothetical protein [Listeria monocytogenes]ECQ6291331.1 hypothetical protein [Listeria monocytogenes]
MYTILKKASGLFFLPKNIGVSAMEKEGLKELQYDLNYLDDNEVQQLIKSIKILKQEIPVEMPEINDLYSIFTAL